MRIQPLMYPASLTAITPAWDALAEDVPFRKWSWLGPWWSQYGVGHELLVLAAQAGDGTLLGVAPWYLEDRGSQGKAIRFLGSGEVCSDYLTLLAKPGCEEQVGRAVSDWLLASGVPSGGHSSPICWDTIELEQIAPGQIALDTLTHRLDAAGCTLYEQPSQGCWRIELPDSWDEYLACLSRPCRRRARACQKRLQQSDVVRRTASTPEELCDGWRILIDLHQQRWTSRGKKGCFASDAFTRFLSTAAGQLLESGTLRLSWLEIAGEPAACLIAMAGGDTIYAYQTGMAMNLQHENPGWMIQTAAIREAIESGAKGFDLLRGDEPYKSHLGASSRSMVDRRIVSRRIAPQLRHRAWVMGRMMKKMIKSSLSAAGMC